MTNLTAPEDARRLETLWRGDFGDAYVGRNSVEYPARRGFWRRTLTSYPARSVLEVGCAHGDNFGYMAPMVDPRRSCGLDLNELALSTVRQQHPEVGAVMAAARTLPVRDRAFDLVFTIGLLIHQPDSTLPAVVAELARCAGTYVMIGEYHSDEPTTIEYRGMSGILFKRDYVRIFAEACPEFRHVATEELTLADDGFDRVTWGVFRRA